MSEGQREGTLCVAKRQWHRNAGRGFRDMSALTVLRHHYRERCAAAEAARAAGIPVVGIVGNTVPVELVRAAGCFPLTLSDLPSDTSVGDEFMEPFFEPEIRYV